jgi:flagellar biosynthesis/type III secretory pathway M-ring protein FliF/YscJ
MPPLNAMPLNNDTVSPGVLGFVVFLALLAATFFLIRSMTKQMKKIQAPSEEELKQQEWERAQETESAAPAKSPADDA